jgi:hypothetical protein
MLPCTSVWQTLNVPGAKASWNPAKGANKRAIGCLEYDSAEESGVGFSSRVSAPVHLRVWKFRALPQSRECR